MHPVRRELWEMENVSHPRIEVDPATGERTDLARFFVYSSNDGDVSLDCYTCSWSSGYDEFPDDLAGLVALAETHRCEVVIEGASEVVRPAIEAAR